jgi:UDP-glucose 4-epimerase
LGSGQGHSVLELLKTFEVVSKKKIPYKIAPRRSGDIALFYADPSLAKEKLHWETEFDLQRMCEDSWRWQLMNPHGYI